MTLIQFIILSLSVVFSDISKSDNNCGLLNEALLSEHIQREFSMCEDDAKIILYDKKGVFEDCDKLSACGKEIRISHDEKYDELSPNNNRSTKDKSIIILHRMERDDLDYILYFWRPYSGAVVNLTYRRKGDKFELVDYVIGTF